jgi:transcriptional regulator with XRE-family HTH domain
MAAALGVGQATVSRIENGQSVPSLPQVQAWCDAAGASAEVRARLAEMAEGALNEFESFRDVAVTGLAPLQEDVRELEATTRVMRFFANSYVPGLLQTEDYARHVMELAAAAPDLEAAVAERMQRQAILADPAREFEFILTEAALRWVPATAGPRLLAGQADRISAMSRLATITVGLIPEGTPSHVLPLSPFILYDERYDDRQPFVTIEVAHGAANTGDPAAIKGYRERMAVLRGDALLGEDARAAIEALRG